MLQVRWRSRKGRQTLLVVQVPKHAMAYHNDILMNQRATRRGMWMFFKGRSCGNRPPNAHK